MSTSNKVEFVWKDQEVNMALPKINFFGYVRNFDWEEKITSDSAVCGINIAAKDGYVVLDFKSYPYKKFAQVGIELNSWRLIEEAVNKSLEHKKEIAVSKYEPDRWNNFPDVTPPEDGHYIVTIDSPVSGPFVTTCLYTKEHGWEEVYQRHVIAFRNFPTAYGREE